MLKYSRIQLGPAPTKRKSGGKAQKVRSAKSLIKEQANLNGMANTYSHPLPSSILYSPKWKIQKSKHTPHQRDE